MTEDGLFMAFIIFLLLLEAAIIAVLFLIGLKGGNHGKQKEKNEVEDHTP